MLKFAGAPYKVPDNIFVHGFITFTGEKMSKSRGTGISPELYLDLGLNPEWLRYYIAAKLNAKVEDLDFNPDDFLARVNSDLIGKYVNIASRAARFIAQTGNKLAATTGFDARHGRALRALTDSIADLYANREFGKALREVMELADRTNEYFDRNKPWEAAKRPDGVERVQQICSECIDDFRILTTLLKPVLPAVAASAELFLQIPSQAWSDLGTALPAGHAIGDYKHLLNRIDPKLVDALLEGPKAAAGSVAAPAAEPGAATTPVAPPISIDEFSKVDLRVARIVNAEQVNGADKLLKLTLDVGEARHRTVFAGIKSAYQPQDLIGRLTPMVANLAPRKMKFGVSEGMVLAASGEGPGIFLLAPDSGAEPGMRVK
jgi:methionyl-tRNA synthetase